MQYTYLHQERLDSLLSEYEVVVAEAVGNGINIVTQVTFTPSNEINVKLTGLHSKLELHPVRIFLHNHPDHYRSVMLLLSYC